MSSILYVYFCVECNRNDFLIFFSFYYSCNFSTIGKACFSYIQIKIRIPVPITKHTTYISTLCCPVKANTDLSIIYCYGNRWIHFCQNAWSIGFCFSNHIFYIRTCSGTIDIFCHGSSHSRTIILKIVSPFRSSPCFRTS